MALRNGDRFQGIDEREDSKLYHLSILNALGIGEETERRVHRGICLKIRRFPICFPYLSAFLLRVSGSQETPVGVCG